MSARIEGRMEKRAFPARQWMVALSLLALAMSAPLAVQAAQPRPWLCRDKPVFSSPNQAQLTVRRHDRRQWEVFLMKFNINSGHDGFTVTSSYPLRGDSPSSAIVGRGQFYAVALFRANGHWFCPARVVDNTRPGELANFCYHANNPGLCDISLTASSNR
ncbi:MAG TPA: hypothetical protein VKV28_02825 [Candidatus Binataceae bacterium]|nr:hypothetical protein [Candidatus Binataceae bacterium]